ncbi:MAG: hypothetical protein H0T89_16785 [Deltaproteobacteria bacterium]|nr:hypothetical protein [Deltaproteobacteria bacterium]MDQ3296123.1 hypothetical protein [Myxococcota bacterium]
MKLICLSSITLLGTLLGAACGGGDDGIDSDEEARRAYLGLDTSIEKSLTLGFAGFNSATSANIAPQTTTGILAGTLVITGQVDQGSSTNKGLRLKVGMTDYSDGAIVVEGDNVEVDISYDTNVDVALQPALTLNLKNFPGGTLDGTLIGDYVMEGDVDGTATLNLSFAGMTMDGGNGLVLRVPGSTTVTGTATTGDGTYEVNLTL